MKRLSRHTVTAATILLLLAAVTSAQDDADAAALSGGPAPTTQPAGQAPADLEALLAQMTPEELSAFVKAAATKRLTRERKLVSAELTEGLLYDPVDIRAAQKALADNPANTQSDNIDRIYKAFARVDRDFRKVYDLYFHKKYEEAAGTVRTMLDVNQTSYRSAALHMLCADSLAKAQRCDDAIEVYRDILMNMPDRISFAAGGALAAAETYEEAGRFRYAMEMYVFCYNNYGLTLSDEQIVSILAKVDEYRQMYEDPLGTVVTEMASVKRRLAMADSGEKTREGQKKIVSILDDLIRTAQEQQQQQQQGGSSGQKQAKNDLNRQQQQKQNQQAGAPSGQPTKPAETSGLTAGVPGRPRKTAETHTTDESGDWASLPPRQRAEMKAMMRKMLSERYRDLVRDYHSSMAEEKP